jgi:hypothetical protein
MSELAAHPTAKSPDILVIDAAAPPDGENEAETLFTFP